MSIVRYVALEVPPLGGAELAGAPSTKLDGSAPFSVDAWVKLDGLGDLGGVLSQSDGFTFGVTGRRVVLQIPGWPGATSTSAHPLDQDDWHHICATFDGTWVRLFVDGAFDSATAVSGAPRPVSAPWRIGTGLQGIVRGVRVFNVALTPEQVLSNMFGTPSPVTIANAFDFTVNPPVDTGPSHVGIRLLGGARVVTRTPAVALRDRAYVQPLVEDSVNPGGQQVDPYTVQAWVHIDPQEQPVQVIFTNSDLLTDTGIALLAVADAADGRLLRLVSTRGSAETGTWLESTRTFPGATWTNVAATFDRTTLTLFIDGTPAGTMAAGPTLLPQEVGEPLIGGSHTEDEPLADWTLQGWVARLDVWSEALTQQEIAAAAEAPPDPLSPGLATAYDFSSAPVRDAVDNHPVGLVDGARLAPQVSPGAVAAALRDDGFEDHEEVLDDGFEGYEPLDADVLAGLLAEVRRADDEPVLLTRHEVGEELVLLLHSPQGVHLAYRGRVGDVEPCLMWRIELAFTVFAGIMIIAFSVAPTLTPRVIAILQRVLTAARVGAAQSPLGTATATGVIGLLAAAYDAGAIFELLKALLVGAGYFAALRIVAKFIALATGLGAAEMIVAAAAAAIAVAKVWARRPVSCDPPPKVALAAIKFNWDPTSAAADALSIRRNAGVGVLAPEWQSTKPNDSAAAYALSSVSGQTPKILAKLVIADTTAQQATVQASGGGPLGAIDATVVKFKNGVSDPEWVPLTLPHHTIPTGGVRAVDATWNWTVAQQGGAAVPLATTTHRIYVTLNPPTEPWIQPPTSDQGQLPWIDALELACAWAAGQTTVAGVLTAVTTVVNSSPRLKYDTSRGASFYTKNGVFLLTELIARLKGDQAQGEKVNCTDCATIVTTFANLLGADVFAWRMTSKVPNNPGFMCNQIQAIGFNVWAYPFVGGFKYHEIAWTGAGTYGDQVWDACLKYDTGPDPWDWSQGKSHTPGLPAGPPFSSQTTFPTPLPIPTPLTAATYRERLARNEEKGIGACIPYGAQPGSNSGRRRVL